MELYINEKFARPRKISINNCGSAHRTLGSELAGTYKMPKVNQWDFKLKSRKFAMLPAKLTETHYPFVVSD